MAAAVPFFAGLPAASFLAARRLSSEGQRWWFACSVTSGCLSLIGATLALAGFGGNPRLVRRAGTFQRIAIVGGLGWLSAFSTLLLVGPVGGR